MIWDYGERRKRERNYRLMFKTALAGFVLGIGCDGVWPRASGVVVQHRRSWWAA